MTKYYGQEDDNPTEWEESTWNFKSEYWRERLRRMKEEYYERLERTRKHPPDEDDWNK